MSMEVCTVADPQLVRQVLSLIPQQRPFRFIDEITGMDEKQITATYRFREDEYFYEGHFPGHPVTPGVILIETMAQAGVVALGIGLLLLKGIAEEEIRKMKTLFTFAESVEFTGMVAPGEKVIVRGEKIYFRKGNIKTEVSIARESGESVCSGVLMGTGVKFDEQ